MKNVNSKLNIAAIVSLLVLCGGVAQAGQVGVMNTFSSGSPAVAADVNANFDAQTTAINDNDTRIAALEAALANLTGDQCATGSVSGQYKVVTQETMLSNNETLWDPADPTIGNIGFNGARLMVSKGDLTINSDNTFTFVETHLDEVEVYTGSAPVSWFTTVDSTPVTGTYTIDATCKVTLTLPDASILEMHMTPDLSSGIGRKAETYSAGALFKEYITEITTVTKKNL